MLDRLRRCGKKAQFSTEFLLSYSRAILVVIAALGFLTYFGYLSPSYLALESCASFSDITCMDHELRNSRVDIRLHNAKEDPLTIHNVTVFTCSGYDKGVLQDGQEVTFTIPGCNLAVGEKYLGTYTVQYTSYTGLLHSNTGKLVGKVSEG